MKDKKTFSTKAAKFFAKRKKTESTFKNEIDSLELNTKYYSRKNSETFEFKWKCSDDGIATVEFNSSFPEAYVREETYTEELENVIDKNSILLDDTSITEEAAKENALKLASEWIKSHDIDFVSQFPSQDTLKITYDGTDRFQDVEILFSYNDLIFDFKFSRDDRPSAHTLFNNVVRSAVIDVLNEYKLYDRIGFIASNYQDFFISFIEDSRVVFKIEDTGMNFTLIESDEDLKEFTMNLIYLVHKVSKFFKPKSRDKAKKDDNFIVL